MVNNYFLMGIHTGCMGDSILMPVSFFHNILIAFSSFLFVFVDNNVFISVSS